MRDRVAIAGVGETEYRPWGGITDRSGFQLACEAILAASADAGLSPHDLDGFANVIDVRPGELQVGLPVEVVFEDLEDVTLPRFRPARWAG